jgi:hypothetical protein
VSASEVKGTAVIDERATLLIDNRNGADGLSDTGSGAGHVPPSDPNRAGPDFGGSDYTPTPQSSGPDERDTHQDIKTNPGAAGQSGGHQTGGHQTGQQGNGSEHVAEAAGPIENLAQMLGPDLQTVGQTGSSHAGEAIRPTIIAGVHVGLDAAAPLTGDLGSHDPHAGFMDLIRLAQNPAQSGLVPPPASVSHDAVAALQLSALGDLAGHAGDAHHVDDVHAAAAIALPAAVHEEVGHLNAAAIDHAHAAH